MKNAPASLFLFLVMGISLNAQTVVWSVDKSHSDIRFTTTHMSISEVDGEFKEFDGKVSSTTDDFTGSDVEFTAKVASISTDNERRDDHLKGEDFFNAEKFPELKFKGKIQKEGDRYYLVGDLTIRDITKPIKFNVKYNGQITGSRGRKAGFKVQGAIDRFEYGLQWNRMMEAGGLVVGKEVEITCNIELNENQS